MENSSEPKTQWRQLIKENLPVLKVILRDPSIQEARSPWRMVLPTEDLWALLPLMPLYTGRGKTFFTVLDEDVPHWSPQSAAAAAAAVGAHLCGDYKVSDVDDIMALEKLLPIFTPALMKGLGSSVTQGSLFLARCFIRSLMFPWPDSNSVNSEFYAWRVPREKRMGLHREQRLRIDVALYKKTGFTIRDVLMKIYASSRELFDPAIHHSLFFPGGASGIDDILAVHMHVDFSMIGDVSIADVWSGQRKARDFLVRRIEEFRSTPKGQDVFYFLQDVLSELIAVAQGREELAASA